MAAYRNKHQGTCHVCGETVLPMKGELTGPPWKVRCAKCAGLTDTVSIKATLEDGNVVFQPVGFLGERFSEYKDATSTARYVSERRVNVANLATGLGVIQALQNRSFTVDVAPGLSAAIQAFLSTMQTNVEEAGTRSDEVDARLRERGLYLFPFQKQGIRWLASRMTALLSDEMGLGKTIQALTSLPVNVPVIVVAPAVAKGVWRREILKWRPDFRITVLSGRSSFRWPQPGEVVIVNYDILPKDPTARTLILDVLPMVERSEKMDSLKVDVQPGDQLVLDVESKSGPLSQFAVSVSAQGGSKNDRQIGMWDENTEASKRTMTIAPTYENTDVVDGTTREFAPKQVHVMWSVIEKVKFSVKLIRQRAAIDYTPVPKTYLIADEAHAVKNSKAQRTEKFRLLSDIVQKNLGGVFLLTATPLLNRAVELWTLLQSANLAKEAFGNWDNFVNLFGGYKGPYGYVWGTPKQAAVSERLKKVMLRRERAEVLPELPVKTYRTIPIELDAKSREICDEANAFLEGLMPTVWSEIEEDTDPPRARTPEEVEKAEQVLADIRAAMENKGTSFRQFSRALATLAKAKISSMEEWVEQFEEQDEPVVVFSMYLAPIQALAKRPGWRIITGDTPNDERTEIEEAFQAGKIKGIGATIKAGGVAITLTRACQALFVDEAPTPALNEQAEDRVCRIGQSRGVIINKLVANHPLDIRLAVINGVKRNVIHASVNASRVTEIEPEQLSEPDFAKLAEEAAEEARKSDDAKHVAEDRVRQIESLRAAGGTAPVSCRREPNNEREVWAMKALLTLAALDPDHAEVLNDVGFNSADGEFGHSLAQQATTRGLTTKQWTFAIAICTKYWRQVGRPPAAPAKAS